MVAAFVAGTRRPTWPGTGRMDRGEASERLNEMPSQKVVNYVTDKLGVPRLVPQA